MDKKLTDKTEKVYAWLIPENMSCPMIPLGTKGRIFGYNRKACDIALKNICADEEQAEIGWDGKNVYITNLSKNGLTFLNGEVVENVCEPVYHEECISLGGEGFRLYRCDKVSRPILKFKVSFICDDELIAEREYFRGEELDIPSMPVLREDDDTLRKFVNWVDQDGEVLTPGCICSKSASYSAVYIPEDAATATTVCGKNKIVLLNSDSYRMFVVSERDLKFGGSKTCDFCFTALSGVCVELAHGTGAITAYRNDTVRVNGTSLSAGASVVLRNRDTLEIAGRTYTVISQVKAAQPVLLNKSSGAKAVLEDLTEGKTITIGRRHQEILSSVFFVGGDHAFISMKDGKYYLRDNNSKNGTSIKKHGSDKVVPLLSLIHI